MRRAGTAVAVSLLTLVLCAPTAGAATGDLAKEVAAAKARANAAAARLNNAQTALALAERDVEQLTAQADAMHARVGRLEAQVRTIAVERYMTGSSGPMLATADLSALARADAMIRMLALGSSDALDSFRVAQSDLEANRRAMAQRLRDRRSAVAAIRADETKAAAELNTLGAALAALEARAAKSGHTAAASRGRTGVIVTGDWVCPVQGPHSFSDDFGAPRSGGRSHQGNDILAPRGTPVVANVAGSVSHNESNLGGHGYFLHGNDGNTYYGAHLDSYTNSVGNVAAGTVIGYVGDTGDARGGVTHLHFEIHPGGGPAVDPYLTLRKYC